VKIITLIENLVYKQDMHAEHGLSLYIEADNKKILFDTGQSDSFLLNAQKLGVNIADIDILVLSHGHYDHTGGLYPFFKKNSKAVVYAKRGILTPKYHGRDRFIGTYINHILLNNRIIYLDSVTEIDHNIFVMTDINIYNAIDTHFKGLSKEIDRQLVPDDFTDELFLAIKKEDNINIITACSHRGITNICKTATNYFKLPVGLILGGFHTKDSTDEQYAFIMNYFKQLEPKIVGVCHCTGVEQFARMHNDCKTPVFYNFTGNIVNL
jgi:7,8-dihydropterin-6-yl-methyl-4-(beta-D-ribofuranosyl)aminobenzene 5'-phosphate synthase